MADGGRAARPGLTPALRVLLRPDARAEAGLGHLARCTSLARALARAGAVPVFRVEAGALPALRAAGWEAEEAVPAEGDALGVLEEAGAFAAVVVDSYVLHPGLVERLYASARRLVLVDDLAELYAPADLVVNGAAHAASLAYDPARVGALLAGTRYLLLRPDFAEAPAPRPVPPRPERVLVAMGGGDPLGRMAPVLETVRAAVGEGPVLDAVVGPFFGAEWGARADAAWDARGVRLHRGKADLRPLMLRADLAVTAAGLALYELAACGVPTVAFSIAPNQRPQLAALAGAGALVSAGDAGEPGFEARLRDAAASLAASAPAREAAAREAHRAVDGRGAERVAARLLALCAAPRGTAPLVTSSRPPDTGAQ